MALTIRFATSVDSHAIAELLLTAFAEIKPVYTAGGFDATVLDAERVRARMEEGPVWIAMVDEVVAGTVAARVESTGLYMRGMAVHPAFRGREIGKDLLDTVEQFAREHHCKRIFLSTAPYLLSAIRLYERNGFIRISDPPHELFGTPLLTMEKNYALNSATNFNDLQVFRI